MDSPAPVLLKRLADYRPPDWLVPDIALRFELAADRTIVHARLQVERNGAHDRPLRLNGDGLETLSVALDGIPQPIAGPIVSPDTLSLSISADSAIVETVVAIHPAANSQLMGLYASSGNLITQCEAEGFRRISWFPDRPDVLSRYHVRLEADLAHYPVLLGNGDLLAEGALPDGRHFAEWQDPHPKPCYLFALVAGPLSALRDSFTTASGREVALAIWVAPDDVPRCRHAMLSLKQSMAWDEAEYGREYDLDRFNIVAVHDFNFGAMENKGLNIFNARYILADADTATDSDFDAIAAVVAHEYFHNWSGNRVTCRDWFQLSLKEGFTVFRDQQFSESLGSAAVKRIESVRSLRTFQFPEDDGPLAHPVQPQTYQEISNFYTATIYNKGAELVRMTRRLLGAAQFRRATDRFFADQDGRAATIDDFLAAMEIEGLDVHAFRRWYAVAGTPRLSAIVTHDAARARATVNLSQRNPRSPDAPPLPIPLDLALFSRSGEKLASLDGAVLDTGFADYQFERIGAPPILSANRGFAAPVLLQAEPSRADLALLARAEDDDFARYDSLQQLMMSALLESAQMGRVEGADDVAMALAPLLAGWEADPALAAESILLPPESLIGDRMAALDPDAVHRAREGMRAALSERLSGPLWTAFRAARPDAQKLDGHNKGLRRLKAVLLSLLMASDSAEARAAARDQFLAARTMTDRMAALVALANSKSAQRDEVLALFYQHYHGRPEVLDKWFAAQAASTRPDTLDTVRTLLSHPQFDRRNPNRLRALVLGYAMNQPRFHRRDGAGYQLLAHEIAAVDPLNPQSAARLAAPLTRWRRLAPEWSLPMRAALEQIAAMPHVSKDLFEVVNQSLQ